MFRPISRSIQKRQSSLVNNTHKQHSLDVVLKDFLTNTFGADARHMTVEASREGKTVYLKISSKVAAQEIMFHSAKLYQTLKQNGIACDTVVVR